MLRVVSSQRFLDGEIIEEKVEDLKDNDFIIIPIIDAEMQDLDGNDLYILSDGHHRKAAAELLGIEVRYEEVKNEHNLTGEALLDECYNDSDWYYVDTEITVW